MHLPPFEICSNFKTYYIKKNRELTKDDFIPLTSKENSILFITEDDWEEVETPTIQSHKPYFQKRYCLQYRGLKELLGLTLDQDIDSYSDVKDLISTLRASTSQHISLSFNWKGSPYKSHREKKLERKKKEFNDHFQAVSSTKEELLLNTFRDQINKKINYINERYVDRVTNHIKNNLHGCVPETDATLEEEAKVFIDKIEVINKELTSLRKELNEIRLKQKAIKLTVVQNHFKEQPLPESIKEKLLEKFEQEKTKSDALPFL